MFKMIKRYMARQNTISQLNQMSDRELNDIGISRGDIFNVASMGKNYTRM